MPARARRAAVRGRGDRQPRPAGRRRGRRGAARARPRRRRAGARARRGRRRRHVAGGRGRRRARRGRHARPARAADRRGPARGGARRRSAAGTVTHFSVERPTLAELFRAAEDRGGFAFVALLLLYGQLISMGYFVAMGVVEEKSTRVVEVVLSTLRPRHLLAGEIHGLGLLGLAQLLLLALVGIGTAAAAGALEVNRDVLVAALLALAWFVVGYAFYAAAFGCAAAARVAPGRPAVGDLAADDRADGRLLHLVRRARGPRRHAGGDGDEAARGLARGRAPRPAGPAAARRRRWRRRSARRPPRGGCAPARPCPRGSCARRRSRRPRSSAAT